MKKSPDAFRTISEVAAWLETPAHVLRFWESRFPDLKPVQRAGGRRYYRRDDMLLLGGIKHLLHTEGHTIKSVQDRIATNGTSAVAAFSQPLGLAEVADTAAVTAPEVIQAFSRGDADTGGRAGADLSRTDDDAPPIGFFFDDSDDAAPAEAQSGTFAQALTFDLPAEQVPLADPIGQTARDDPAPMDQPAAESPVPDLVPRLGPMPNMADDPADDAAGFGSPLPLSARLRALHRDDVPAMHRDVLVGLFRRLEGWHHATE